MPEVLLVAATERELDGRDGLVCGIGPVEAAAATAPRPGASASPPSSTSASPEGVGSSRARW